MSCEEWGLWGVLPSRHLGKSVAIRGACKSIYLRDFEVLAFLKWAFRIWQYEEVHYLTYETLLDLSCSANRLTVGGADIPSRAQAICKQQGTTLSMNFSRDCSDFSWMDQICFDPELTASEHYNNGNGFTSEGSKGKPTDDRSQLFWNLVAAHFTGLIWRLLLFMEKH